LVTKNAQAKKTFFQYQTTQAKKTFRNYQRKLFSVEFLFLLFFKFFPMFLIRKKKKNMLFFSFADVWSQKTHKSKNFFPVPSHTGQENFLKLPKKNFFSKIFIFTCFFNFFPASLIRKSNKKCFFLVLSVFAHKKRTNRQNFFPVPNHTGRENFLKLPKKSFFSKNLIFTCFFRFFLMSLISKKQKNLFF
jgi:hypothetical protein